MVTVGELQVGRRFQTKGQGEVIYEIVSMTKTRIGTRMVSSKSFPNGSLGGVAEISISKLPGIIEKFVD
jgi:hypothetical protein